MTKTVAAEHAASLASRAVELAERFGAPGPIGCALRVRGLAEHDLEALRMAEHALAALVVRLEHARSMVELRAARLAAAGLSTVRSLSTSS